MQRDLQRCLCTATRGDFEHLEAQPGGLGRSTRRDRRIVKDQQLGAFRRPDTVAQVQSRIGCTEAVALCDAALTVWAKGKCPGEAERRVNPCHGGAYENVVAALRAVDDGQGAPGG